jgi:FAD/FMN-containing dehydrogenase
LTAAAPDLRAQLRAIVGEAGLLAEGAAAVPYLTDHRRLYQGRALAVVLPASVTEVAAVLRLCAAARIAVVPHGGNTSYCGGATPDASGQQLVLALARLNRLRSIDAVNDCLIAEAGCTLAQIQAAAQSAGRFFPLSLGSQGSCQIGGNLATNAGGTSVLRYGMMRDLVLGLEVVLADGRVLEGLSGLRKDNTGYDVKSLFIGAEGTLGVITAASLKLFPEVRARATALVAVADVPAAVALLAHLKTASSERVSSFELMPRLALELTLRHIDGARDPFGHPHPWYVLCELTSARAADALDVILEEALGGALEHGQIEDALISTSERERQAFWRLRENIPAAQSRAGASLKHDISLPVSRLAEFLARAAPWIETAVPEGRLIAYGHVGDGNLHFNVSARSAGEDAALLGRAESVRRWVHDLVCEFGGSFSAEHGIGQLKVAELERYATPVELAVMRSIKAALDPHGIMNPGKVLRFGAAENP